MGTCGVSMFTNQPYLQHTLTTGAPWWPVPTEKQSDREIKTDPTTIVFMWVINDFQNDGISIMFFFFTFQSVIMVIFMVSNVT